MKTPLWKIVLCWGSVVIFLLLPLVMMTIQVYHLTHPGWVVPLIKGEKPDFAYLNDFMRNITILVFGLAGLRTWEQVKANGNGKIIDNGGRKES